MSSHAETIARGSMPPAPPTTDRPDRTLLTIVMLAGLALAGMLALLPSSEEKAAGLFEEERYDEAIAMLVSLEDQRPLNAYEGFMLFNLYVVTRQPDNAAAVLEQDVSLQLDRSWALGQLAGLYRDERNFAGEASVLRPLYEIAPSEAIFRRLQALYRLTGDTANEALLLGAAIAAGQHGDVQQQRLSYLQSLPPSGGKSVLWTAESGPGFVEGEGLTLLAVSHPAAPQTVSVE